VNDDTDDMNDGAVLGAVRDALSEVPMPGPPRPEVIMTRGRARQRRWLAGLSVSGAVAVAAVILGVSGVFGSGGSVPAAGAAHLAAFSVVSSSDGTVTVSISAGQLLDPGALRQALAAHDVPALVTSGSFCTSDPTPSGFSQVVLPELKPLPDQIVLVIKPSAMPSGVELSIGDFGGNPAQASVVLISTDAYTCSSVRPTALRGQGRMLSQGGSHKRRA
jgi:hypothetical protein